MPDESGLKKTIAGATIITTGSVFLSRVFGLVRDLVLAHLSGTSSATEAYVAAFLLPELINHLLAGGFLSVTFIPIYQRHLVRNDLLSAQRTCNNLLTIGTMVLATIVIICSLFTDNMLSAIEIIKNRQPTPARRPDQWVALTTRLSRIVLPAQIFLYWGSFLSAVQYAHQRFLLPALMPLCYNAGIILGGVFLWPLVGIEGFAWGVLAGSFVGGVAVQIAGVRRLDLRFKPVIDFRDPDLHRYVGLSLPFVVGMSLTFSNEFFFRFFGLFLPQGALASLNYALRVMMLVVGIFGLAIGAASFPFLSQLAAEGKNAEMAQLAFKLIVRTSAAVLPVCAVMFATAPEILAVLFQRGQFSRASTLATAPALQMYLIGAFAFTASAIVSRCFYAVQNTLLPMLVGTASVVATLPLYWLLGRRFGAAGIGLAGSLSSVVQFLALLFFWNVRFNGRGTITMIMQSFFRIALAASGAGCVCAAIRYVLITAAGRQPSGFFGNLLTGLTSQAAGMVVAVVLLEVLRVQSIRETIRLFLPRYSSDCSHTTPHRIPPS